MRDKFAEQLKQLNSGLIEMGEMCENAITLATDALINNNLDSAANVPHIESDIDEKERQIESLCLRLLLKQQPVAGDLRHVSAALKMITDMERIGDQALDIAELAQYVGGDMETFKVKEMSRAVIYMVTESINAYVAKDTALAAQIIRYDDEVDRLFDEIKEGVVNMLINDENAEKAIDLLMIAKYLERIGDHAGNIANWVVFAVTGGHAEK